MSHLIKAGEFGWRDDAAVWPAYFDDSVAPVMNIGPGSPSGSVFGYGAAFPEKFQRALFVCDWTFATIHAVFLQPSGASYRAEVQEFLGGNGLPLTDVVIGKDGAMYFTVGGRRLGSAVYRVRYVGDEPVLPLADAQSREPLQIRRQAIEAHYERKDPAIIADVWADLGSGDRAIRFAARTKQPWRGRSLRRAQPSLRRKVPDVIGPSILPSKLSRRDRAVATLLRAARCSPPSVAWRVIVSAAKAAPLDLIWQASASDSPCRISWIPS